jgi:hypothetical protein
MNKVDKCIAVLQLLRDRQGAVYATELEALGLYHGHGWTRRIVIVALQTVGAIQIIGSYKSAKYQLTDIGLKLLAIYEQDLT